MAKLVLDTNVLLRSLPSVSKYHDLYKSFFDGRNTMCVSNEILEEYEEILSRKLPSSLVKLIINQLVENPFTQFSTPYFRFNLIQGDPDDNKFVDCAICEGAKYIVTEDRHFQILKEIYFPKVNIISLEEIMSQL